MPKPANFYCKEVFLLELAKNHNKIHAIESDVISTVESV